MIDDAAFEGHRQRGLNEPIRKLRRKKVEEDETSFYTLRPSEWRFRGRQPIVVNYNALKRWIHNNIGRSFDDVYSELSQKPNAQALKKAFKSYIYTHNLWSTGTSLPLEPHGGSPYDLIYIDKDGILQEIKKDTKYDPNSWKRPKISETDYDWFMITSNRVAIRSDKGVWFEILLSNKMREQVYISKVWDETTKDYKSVSTIQKVPAHKQIYPCSKKFWVYSKVFKKDYYNRGFMADWYPIELTQMSSKRKTQLGILN